MIRSMYKRPKSVGDENDSMWRAIFKQNTQIMDQLINKGYPLDGKHLTTSGWELTHVAAANGKNKVIKFLISKGANINATDIKGWTPFMWAIERKHFDTAILLYEHGASLKAVDFDNNDIVYDLLMDSKNAKFFVYLNWSLRKPLLFAYKLTKQRCATGYYDKITEENGKEVTLFTEDEVVETNWRDAEKTMETEEKEPEIEADTKEKENIDKIDDEDRLDSKTNGSTTKDSFDDSKQESRLRSEQSMTTTQEEATKKKDEEDKESENETSDIQNDGEKKEEGTMASATTDPQKEEAETVGQEAFYTARERLDDDEPEGDQEISTKSQSREENSSPDETDNTHESSETTQMAENGEDSESGDEFERSVDSPSKNSQSSHLSSLTTTKIFVKALAPKALSRLSESMIQELCTYI